MNCNSDFVEQRTDEWKRLRQGRVTASIVGAILGISPHMSAKDARKILNGTSEFQGNQATEWGVFNEEGAIAQFEMETGLSVKKASFVPFGNWLGASPDGYVSDGKLLEVKCPFGLRKGGEFKSISEQPHYYAQMQIQMLCCNKKECWFYQWSPFGSMTEIVERDNNYIDKIVPILKDFYNEVEKDIVKEFFKNKELIEELQNRQKEIINELSSNVIGDSAMFGEHKLYKVSKDGSISYAKAFKDLMPEVDLSQYKGEKTEYWVLK